MTRPAVSTFTERLYGRLPELYRDADEAQAAGPSGYPLLRYLSLLLDQAGDVETIIDRVDYTGEPGDTSDLADPATADAAWLPWLAQLVGVRARRAPTSFADPYGALTAAHPTYADLDAAYGTYADQAAATSTTGGGDLAVDELRTAIANAAAGWRAGTARAIVDMVRPLLTGSQTVRIVSHVDGNPWRVAVRTYVAETPEPWRVERTLDRPETRPAGTSLEHEILPGATYAELSGDFATYANLDAALTDYAATTRYVPA